MPGWFESRTNSGHRDNLINISRFGNTYDDLLLKNSQAIGYIEGELRRRVGTGSAAGDDLLKYSMAISDTTSSMRNKMLAFFQLDYYTKRDKLRDVASNAEIEFVLDTISDDVIVYDSDNRFCHPNDLRIKLAPKKGVRPAESNSLEYTDEFIEDYEKTFAQVYNAWGFDNGLAAWQYFYLWLIEGLFAAEIIYDNIAKPTKIIGFKDLDPSFLFPMTKFDDKGKLFIEWIQRDPYTGQHRTLTDAQVIYISYSHHFRTKRVSFVERMIRSFNMLRIIEHSKVIWHIMNAPIRLKTTVPIGTQSLQKSQQAMNEFLNTFKEDIYFNQESGELLVDGRPKILFYKNYVVPKNDRGEQVDIEAIEHKGPDLQDNQLLSYFLKKLKLDSKLPFSRWDYNEGGGSYLLGPDTVNREEISYQKFVRRLRTGFQEIFIKPWYIQMCMNHPSLKDDVRFKHLMGVTYNEENVFEEMKDAELLKKRVESITTLQGIKASDDTFWNTNFLARKYLKFENADFELNDAEWAKQIAQKGKPAGEAGAQPGAQAAGGASALGGAQAAPPEGGAQAAPPEGGAQAAPPEGGAQAAPPA
jgi:hypothetical protein